MSVAINTIRELAFQARTDPDAFLLLAGGLASAIPYTRPAGRAMLVYGLVRTADRYADLFAQSVQRRGAAYQLLAHAQNPAAVPAP
jgi:hypothetical protein